MGHISLPELDREGKPVMILPDPEAVKAARAANAQHFAAMKRALPPGSNVRVAPVATVPVPVMKVERDVFMTFGGVYDLPADNEDVKNYVSLGYLVQCGETVRGNSGQPAGAGGRAPGGAEGEE